MRFLVDTHTFLWAALETRQLSSTAIELLNDAANEVLLSHASAWEIAIKYQLGKLQLPKPPLEFVETQFTLLGIEPLLIKLVHLQPLESMPLHHRDPFDRLLIAQCLTENIPILSHDGALDKYTGITRLW